jgi:hypothetical protein
LQNPLSEHLAGNQVELRGLIEEINHQTPEIQKWSAQVQNINTDFQKILK